MNSASSPSSSMRGLMAVIAGASALGFAAIFVKWGLLGGASPLTVGLYRMLFALPGIYLLARRSGSIRWSNGAGWAVVAGVAFSLDLVFWHHAMNHTSAANATFIVCGLAPVWVALVSVTFGRTRYRLTGWLGQLLGITGALLLALARGARVGDGQGEILAIVASVCYAAFSLTITVSRRTLSAILALFWMSLGSFGSFLLQELYLREPLGGYTPLAWFGLVGLGVLIQLLAWWLINSGLGQVPVALGALALGFQQVATPFLAAWLLGEVLRPLGLLGGTAIFAGILLVATGERRLSVIPAGRSGH